MILENAVQRIVSAVQTDAFGVEIRIRFLHKWCAEVYLVSRDQTPVNVLCAKFEYSTLQEAFDAMVKWAESGNNMAIYTAQGMLDKFGNGWTLDMKKKQRGQDSLIKVSRGNEQKFFFIYNGVFFETMEDVWTEES